MSFGIGINTGPAHVGNTGSQHKFKYGPLGNTVNLASRVQGLTKYLKCRMLVTAATQKHLDKRFISRRICQTRAVNIHEPVTLYEVERAGSEARRLFFKEFQDALDAFEGSDFARAARAAGTLLLDHPGDGPLQLLLSRAANQLMNEDAEFDPIWAPPGK
jgi:adenylate cyclase